MGFREPFSDLLMKETAPPVESVDQAWMTDHIGRIIISRVVRDKCFRGRSGIYVKCLATPARHEIEGGGVDSRLRWDRAPSINYLEAPGLAKGTISENFVSVQVSL
jgi:hypothetical protein